MARKGREKSKIGIYHILMRGVNTLFDNDADYEEFCNILKKYSDENKIKIISYVLLDNRIHLVVDTAGEGVGMVLKPVCTSYARYFNRTHNVEGKLFYDRFKSEPIDSAEELKGVVAFVNSVAKREGELYSSLNDESRNICKYKEAGMRYEEFISSEVNAMYLEDYDCLKQGAVEEYIYALCKTEVKNFRKLPREEQERLFAVITEKKWIPKSKLAEILKMKKSVTSLTEAKTLGKTPIKEEKKEKKEEPPKPEKKELSVWLL